MLGRTSALSLWLFALPVLGLWQAEEVGRAFDEDGLDKRGFDDERVNRNETLLNEDEFDLRNYDRDGYDLSGFNQRCFNRDGHYLHGGTKFTESARLR